MINPSPFTTSYVEFDLLKKDIFEKSGFSCFDSYGSQPTFYGISSKFELFKNAAGNKLPTGSIAYLMDISQSKLYSAIDDNWY